MGKSSERKRKRDSDVQDDSSPSRSNKVQVLENGVVEAVTDAAGDTNKSGDHRQKKSERKKKRDLEAKHNALVKKEKRAALADASDSLATGEDFVSLGNDNGSKAKAKKLKSQSQAFQAENTQSTSKFRRAVAKKSSPRSIRKAQKAVKIEQAMAEAGLADADAGTADNDREVKSRFIVFVGNLPYSATTEQVEAHFVKLQPTSVRHMTDKATGKSKGFAFLEFRNYDRMKTCLSQYHQSVFDPHKTNIVVEDDKDIVGDDKGPRGSKKTKGGRRLNVELTAGGGGKSAQRQGKLKKKNKKLYEERMKARKNLSRKKEEIEHKKKADAAKHGGVKLTGANADSNMGDIHPSRLGRMGN